jgi:hypothetical protein
MDGWTVAGFRKLIQENPYRVPRARSYGVWANVRKESLPTPICARHKSACKTGFSGAKIAASQIDVEPIGNEFIPFRARSKHRGLAQE